MFLTSSGGCSQVLCMHVRKCRWSGTRLNKHSKVFLDNGESFVYWRKCHTEVCRPSWTSNIIYLCLLCCVLLFPWIHKQAALCVGLLWGHDTYVAAASIAIQLKPRPTIRVLSAVETRAIIELGQTAPSLLGQGVLGLSAFAGWNAPQVKGSQSQLTSGDWQAVGCSILMSKKAFFLSVRIASNDGFHGLFPWFSSRQSVHQDKSFRMIGSFCRVSGSGESWNERFSAESVRLSSSLVLILKRIMIVQWCKQLSIKTTLTKFLSVEERFMFGIGMLLPRYCTSADFTT